MRGSVSKPTFRSSSRSIPVLLYSIYIPSLVYWVALPEMLVCNKRGCTHEILKRSPIFQIAVNRWILYRVSEKCMQH